MAQQQLSPLKWAKWTTFLSEPNKGGKKPFLILQEWYLFCVYVDTCIVLPILEEIIQLDVLTIIQHH